MARVDHWASVRDRSVAAIVETIPPAPPPQAEPPCKNENEIATRIAEKEAELERVCSEIEALGAPLAGPFAAQRIARSVAKAHGLTFQEMVSDRRTIHLVLARQHAMWEIRKHTKLSLPAIARVLRRADHTTILHGIRRHEKRMRNA